MNIPNILTVIRFLLIPVLGFFLFKGMYWQAALFFTLGGLTDILDGYIARKYNMITSWGKLADPIADKLMQITALVILALQGIVPAFIIIIVVAKEAFMGAGSLRLYKKENYVVSANWYGKLATVIFYFAIIIVMFNKTYGTILIWLALLFTLFAFLMYSRDYRKIRNDNK